MSDRPTALFWFRRDLRLNDNHGLYRALTEAGNVQPLFIFDTNILVQLQDKDDRRMSFIYDQLVGLNEELERYEGSLLVEHGKPIEVFRKLIDQNDVQAVYTNHDQEPYALGRDKEVGSLLAQHGIAFRTFKDQVVFERDEVLKSDDTPYTVYTPYMKQWRSKAEKSGIPHHPSEDNLHQLHRSSFNPPPDLKSIGFEYTEYDVPDLPPDVSILKGYADRRDIPAVGGTTKIGVHLRFGTISPRQMIKLGQQHSVTWQNELIWREFFMQILWHFPHVEERAFRKKYDAIPWRNNEDEFERWCEGTTGYPLVDAGMRELRRTGFMHNRIRMVVASFLTKHLLIDWRWGEAWFARWLMDFDLASNNGNWQWAAGTGCDAVPYFRVFNPHTQLEKFDPTLKYVKRWVPEYGTDKYAEPVVEHKVARQRAIDTYKSALNG